MLQIGWATRSITPHSPIWLCGYAARTKNSQGVHDPLYAKTCYISDGKREVALISCDLICLTDQQRQSLGKMVKDSCGVEDIIVGATHTHSGPITCSLLEWEPGRMNAQWVEDALKQIAKTVTLAKRSAGPGAMFSGRSDVPEVAKNRRAGETAVDTELNVLWAEDVSGNISGIIVNYACHPTILDASNYLISADYPGYIYEGLEKKFPGVTAMFFNGACGDINIGYSADSSALGVDMGDLRSYHNAEKMAGYILDGAQRAMQPPTRLEPELMIKRVPLAFPLRKDLSSVKTIENDLAALVQSGLQDVQAKTRYNYLTCLLANVKELCGDGAGVAAGESVILSIGKALLVTVPGELFCQIGMGIKSIFSAQYIPLLLGYANGYLGYIPTSRAFIAGGYECETSVHSREAEQYLLDVMKQAAAELGNGQ